MNQAVDETGNEKEANHLYRIHILLWVGVIVSFVAGAFTGSGWWLIVTGATMGAAEVAGFVAGRTLGTFTGFALKKIHEGDSESTRRRVAANYGKARLAWNLAVGAVLVALGLFVGR